MGAKFGGGGGRTPVSTVTVATLPAPSAANATMEYDVSDLNGGTRLKSDGVSYYTVGAGVAAEGKGVIVVTGSRNLTAADNGATLKYNGTSAITLTLVPGLGQEFGCFIMQCNTGKVSVAATGGASVNAQGAKIATAAQYATIQIKQSIATDSYTVTGQSGT